MDDPYRSSQQIGQCPRCSNPTSADGELGRLVCVAGCGEWYPKDTLDRVLKWPEVTAKPGGTATAWPWGAARCPMCQREMAIGFRQEVRFDYCGAHGLWLDAGEIQAFAQALERS